MAGEFICPRVSVRFIEGTTPSPHKPVVEVRGRKFLRQAATIAVMDCPVPECPVQFQDRTALGTIELSEAGTAVKRTAETDSLIKAREEAKKFIASKCPRIDRGVYKAQPFGR